MKKNKANIKLEQLQKQVERMNHLSSIFDTIYSQYKWDVLIRTDELDEDGENIFREPTEDEWNYERCQVWKEVLEHLDKLLK